jgi:hypothetical protein
MSGTGETQLQVWAISVVRNEADVVVPVVGHLLCQGVDHILIADNLSTDKTRRRLDALAAKYPVTVVDDRDPAYWQAKKMTELARRAGAHGATWIIPFDADELWCCAGGTLRDYFARFDDVDVVVADSYNHYAALYVPLLLGRRQLFAAMAKRDREPNSHKVAFRYRQDVALEMGNHDVNSVLPMRRVRDGTLQVHHYPYRGPRQMIRKVRQGAEAMRLTDYPWHVCGHWRFHAQRSNARIAGTWVKMALRRKGLVRDRRLPEPISPA